MPQHVTFPRVVHVMIEPAGPPKNDPLKYDVCARAELATSARTLANNALFNIPFSTLVGMRRAGRRRPLRRALTTPHEALARFPLWQRCAGRRSSLSQSIGRAFAARDVEITVEPSVVAHWEVARRIQLRIGLVRIPLRAG
jgi:hypothetical protein